MKTTSTLRQALEGAHSQITIWQLEAGCNPETWHDSLQKTFDAGCFLKMEFAYSLGGKVDARMILVDIKTGRDTQLSNGEVFHA